MNKSSKPRPKAPKKFKGEFMATRNTRLAAQTRKLLGKHYASKYRVR